MDLQQQPSRSPADLPTLAFFAIVSLAAIAAGSAGLLLSGAGPGTWMRNPAAWLVGLACAGALAASGRSAFVSKAAILLVLAALSATLFSSAQLGVHRWIDIGPLHINVAALLLPVALVALATSKLPPALFLGAVAAIGLILVAQPDASQASAFLLAAGLLLLRSGTSAAIKIAGTVGMAALIIAAWSRPDPLAPVPQVEGIFSLLADISPPLAVLAAVALAISSLIPLRRASAADHSIGEAAKALALYCVVVAVLPLVGAFPVPLVGLGMSFPVGYWIAMALLCARAPCSRLI